MRFITKVGTEILISLPFWTFGRMASFNVVFRRRDNRDVLAMEVSTLWTVSTLRAKLEARMGIRVHTLKYNRKQIEEDADLGSIGLADGATIFINSQTLVASMPLCARPMHPATRPPAAMETPAEWRCRRPRVSGFSEDVIRERIKRLTEMGGSWEDAEKALRAAAFNMDRAADYLASGNIPEPLGIPPLLTSRFAPKLDDADDSIAVR
jgi:hypothetical protein